MASVVSACRGAAYTTSDQPARGEHNKGGRELVAIVVARSVGQAGVVEEAPTTTATMDEQGVNHLAWQATA